MEKIAVIAPAISSCLFLIFGCIALGGKAAIDFEKPINIQNKNLLLCSSAFLSIFAFYYSYTNGMQEWVIRLLPVVLFSHPIVHIIKKSRLSEVKQFVYKPSDEPIPIWQSPLIWVPAIFALSIVAIKVFG